MKMHLNKDKQTTYETTTDTLPKPETKVLGRVSAILHLGLPIIIAQIGTIVQGGADTMMVGQYGTEELSASGFVNNVFGLIFFFVLGLSYSTTPAVGALWVNGKRDEARTVLNNSLVLSTVGSLGCLLLLTLLYFNLDRLGQPEELMPLIRPYFLVCAISLPFVAVFNSFKQYSDATGDTRTPMWVMLMSNVLNIVGNYLLIFVFDLGLLGAGLATLLSRIFMAVWMWLKVGLGRDVTRNGILRLTRKALPVSVQLCLEAGSFNVCALFMGWIGTAALAAHQVMVVIGSLCFMIYYGFGAAAAIRISHYRGLDDWQEVRKTAYTALILTLCAGGVITSSVIYMCQPVFAIFTTSDEVKALLLTLLPAFAAYQVGDASQTIFANCLRAIEDVKVLMVSSFIAYIIISLPMAYVFAFRFEMGAAGIWWSFPLGLSSAAVMFWLRFRRELKKKGI